MSEMVNRIERVPADYFAPNSISKNEIREAARAVIEAMREPTEAMIRAGQACDDSTTGFVQGADGETHWRAMIAAALSPDAP